MKAICKHRVRRARKVGSQQISKAVETLKVFSVALIFLSFNACNSPGTGPVPVDLAKLPNMHLPNFPANGKQPKNYLIQPGDELSIKFYFNPELNEENLIVRPDGNISLQLVHEIRAASRTPMELKGILTKKYGVHLNNPEIAVIVRTVKAPTQIYVGGEVRQPGQFEMVSALTVLQAIALAQGMQSTANESNVLVIRRTQQNELSTIRVNLKSALAGDDLSQDIALHPYDFVYVPESFF